MRDRRASRRSTRPRSSPTSRASSRWRSPARSKAGASICARSLRSGAPAASSAPACRPHHGRLRARPVVAKPAARRAFSRRGRLGGRRLAPRSHLRSRPEYPRQRSRRPSPTMTAFAASAVRRICCRACATTSARIPTDGSTSPACFTPSGPRTAPKKRPDERASLTARDVRVRMSRPRGQAGFQFAACVLR